MTLIQMTFSGVVLIAAILILRFLLLNRLPKRTFTILWSITALRLIFPFSFPYERSICSLIPKLSCYPEPSGYPVSDPVILPVQDIPLAVPSVYDRIFSFLTPLGHSSVLFGIWLTGFLGVSLFFILLWVKFRRSLRFSSPVDPVFIQDWIAKNCTALHPLKRPLAIRQLDALPAPFTAGIFHPVIYISDHTDWDDSTSLPYILEHEYIHIRRFDNLLKLLLIFAVCLHWFNPLVWAMYFLANRDIELSCDEAVLQTLGMRRKSCYARILISMEESKCAPSPLSAGFCRPPLEERITAIMKAKKFSVPVRIAACLLILAAIIFLITSVHQADNSNGFSTPQAAVDAYLNAFFQKDTDALVSLYPPESFSRAAKLLNTTPAKLKYGQTQALSNITNSFDGYSILSFEELSESEIALTFPEYLPDAACRTSISWSGSDSSFSLYPVCFKDRWYIMYPPFVRHVYTGTAPDNS